MKCEICSKQATLNFVGNDFQCRKSYEGRGELRLNPIPCYRIPMCSKCFEGTVRDLKEMKTKERRLDKGFYILV